MKISINLNLTADLPSSESEFWKERTAEEKLEILEGVKLELGEMFVQELGSGYTNAEVKVEMEVTE